MKRLLFIMVIVNTLIISSLSSCNKNDSLSNPVITPQPPITLNLTAYHWEAEANGSVVSTFANVIPLSGANRSVKVYLVTDDQERLINQPISFMNGELWATNTEKDVRIHFRGNLPTVPYLNIKVVIE